MRSPVIFAAVPYLGGGDASGQAVGRPHRRQDVGTDRRRDDGNYRGELSGGTIGLAEGLSMASTRMWRAKMPIILWLLGVPISLIIILLLFGVV
jgi:hypothetical protein